MNPTVALELDGGERTKIIHLLADHLLNSPCFYSPGADGATVEDIITAEYPAASAAGWVPPLAELATRYPALSDALVCFFQNGMAC